MTDPNFWGPALWTSLHTISFDYPDHPSGTDKQNYNMFFHSLKQVLPCDQCRKHYTKFIEETSPIEPALKNRDTLTRWLVNLHNVVNERLQKGIVTYESVKEKYDNLSGKCSTDICGSNKQNQINQRKTNNLLYLITLLLIIVIVLTIYYQAFFKK